MLQKTQSYVFAIWVLLFAIAPGKCFLQSCLPGGITFSSQAEIDAFPANYPGCIIIEGSVTIGDNFSGDITNLDSLIQLVQINGNLDISENPNLTSIEGLQSLTQVGNGFHINDNESLLHLTGLHSLQSVNELYLWSLPILDLTPLENLTAINSVLEINNNSNLISLHGLHNVNFNSLDLLIIDHNPNLTICNIESLCEYFSTSSGTILISNNAIGCNSESQIEGICNGVTCPTGNLIFKTQPPIDSFSVNYPTCISLPDNVTITWDMTNLDGLQNIEQIGGDLRLNNNAYLDHIDGLSNVHSIGGSLFLLNNSMPTLQGLHNIDSIPGNLTIQSNYKIEHINELSTLQYVNGDIYIHENDSLVSVEGLNNIDPNEVNLLHLYNCPRLSICDNVFTCNYLNDTENAYAIANNESGCDSYFEILQRCNCPQGDVLFSRQSQIDSFPILYPYCANLLGGITINDELAGNITQLDSLIQLQVLAGSLVIENNASLANLLGLSSMTYIPGGLTIRDNDALTSLAGLNFLPLLLTDLIIEQSASLSICDVQSICHYLSDSENPSTISSNSSGCLTRGEVVAYCSDQDGDEIIDSLDNCIIQFNPDQSDTDNDGVGDTCDYGAEHGIGIGTDMPTTRLHVANGVIFSDNNNGSLLMRSPDNSCWILKVNDEGVLSTIKVPCPQ
jgi:hypothetical protein